MLKPLLQSQELIRAINESDLIKSYCGIPSDWKDISKVTKNSVHRHLGNGTYNAVFRSSNVYEDRVYANMLLALGKEGVLGHLEKRFGLKDRIWNEYYMSKSEFKPSLLNYATTTTFHSDQNPETTTFDGYALRSVTSETWSTIRSGAGNTSDDSDVQMQVRITAHGSTSNRFIIISRGKSLFDTSSIGATKVINSAKMYLTPTIGGDDFLLSLSIVSCTTASNTAIADSDYNVSTFGSTKLASDYAISSMTDNVQFSMNLNASGLSNISKTGVSKFGFMLNKDAENSQPTWVASYDSRLILYTAEQANPDYPGLEVTYSDPTHQNILLMGVG